MWGTEQVKQAFSHFGVVTDVKEPQPSMNVLGCSWAFVNFTATWEADKACAAFKNPVIARNLCEVLTTLPSTHHIMMLKWMTSRLKCTAHSMA